ncbi:hypothetical protein ACROYT_G042859 [Oculina patagonica]
MNEKVEDWGDFVNRYTSHSSRHSSPERELDYGDVRLTPSPILSLFNTAEKQFCRRDNIDQCIAYLNQELGVLGFSSLFTPSRNGRGPADTFDIVKLVNSTYELLQQQQRNMKQLTDLEQKNLRTRCDNDNLIQNQKRLKEQLESAEREIAMSNERERQLQGKLKKAKEELKLEREELKKTKANSLHLQKQFEHETRKKEREFSRLKERIHQLLTDKSHERKVGLDILNLINRPAGGQRATWKTGSAKNEEEMYKMLITNYEERQKELLVENSDLRETLQNMQAELVNLLNQQNEGYESNTEGGDTSSVDELSSGHFHMPYDMVREGIESSLREKWRILKSRLEEANRGSTNGSSKSDEVLSLERQIENYRHVVGQQENLIESLQSRVNSLNSPEKDSSLLSDSQLYHEQEELESNKLIFAEQKTVLENERRQLADAAVKLGHERKKFEEERASFYKQQLLTPTRKHSLEGRKSKSPDGPRLKFSPMSFSPAPRGLLLSEARVSPNIPREGPLEIPNTEELYTALSLRTDNYKTINEFNETPLKGYATVDESTRKSSPTRQPSSGDSLKENQCDSNTAGERQARRINEHARNVKKALQMKRSSSGDI